MAASLSISQITTYLACSLKYKFRYIDQLSTPGISSAYALDLAIHATTAWLHEKWAAGETVTTQSALQIFAADWYALNQQTVRYADDGSAERVLKLGQDILRVYINQASRQGILHTKHAFKVPLVNVVTGESLSVSLTGVVDKIEAGDVLVDIKTGSKTLSPVDLASNVKLSAYGYAYLMLKRKSAFLRVDLLLKSDPPHFEQQTTRRLINDYAAFFNLCQAVYESIEKKIFLPNLGWRCRDCEYRPVCWFWSKTGKPAGR